MGFNRFYRPVLQLHDVLDSPLARAEMSLGLPIRLPRHLRRDANSGALAGLALAPAGVGRELMPHVLAFACAECALEAAWNLARYRPDVFGGAGPRAKEKSEDAGNRAAGTATAAVVECAPCADRCCVS